MTVTKRQRKYRQAVVRILQFYARENTKLRVLRTPAELQALHGERVGARGQNR